jgi:hypothetical protein
VKHIPFDEEIVDFDLNPIHSKYELYLLKKSIVNDTIQNSVTILDTETFEVKNLPNKVELNNIDLDEISVNNDGSFYLTLDNDMLSNEDDKEGTIIYYSREDNAVSLFSTLYGQPIAIKSVDGSVEGSKAYAISQTPNRDEGVLHIINENKVEKNIELHYRPRDIDVNPYSGNIYILQSNIIHITDGLTLKEIYNIELPERHANKLVVNPENDMIYVTHSDAKRISIINETSKTDITTISFGKPSNGTGSTYPITSVDLNPITNLVYITSEEDNSFYMMDSSKNKLVRGVTFSIEPHNSGYIKCNNEEMPTETYVRLETGIVCNAHENNGFTFSSWSENLRNNSSQSVTTTRNAPSLTSYLLNLISFNQDKSAASIFVSNNGNFSANFKEAPPPIPEEYLIGLYTLTATVFTGWLVPNLARVINHRLQNRQVRRLLKEFIEKAKKPNQEDIDGIVDDFKGKIVGLYAKGKINESQFKVLNEELTRLFKKQNT